MPGLSQTNLSLDEGASPLFAVLLYNRHIKTNFLMSSEVYEIIQDAVEIEKNS
jgi:hypothetical protein